MEYVIKGREPANLYRFFEDISAIPRASGNEAAIAQHMKRFAEERGLWVKVDASNNVIIKKPGSKGCEHLPAVMLQGHLDMVPETAEGVRHDWSKDPLKLRVDGDILTAEGTTLGADDGYAIAYMMAILDRNDLVHPPLECVMTSMEEIGLIGAMALSGADLTATRMIGLDAGSEGSFLASSAGGHRVAVSAPAHYVPATGKGLRIRVGGLAGGHSGGMINKERGSAIKLIGRILYELSQQCRFGIAAIDGGFVDNAIPKECECVILVADGEADKAREIIRRVESEIKVELRDSDGGVRVEVSEAAAERMLDETSTRIVTRLAHVLPYGVMNKSMVFEGLVIGSVNIGIVRTEAERVLFDISVRSAEDSLGSYISGVIADIAEACGARYERTQGYPAFPYSPTSPVRQLALDLYKELTDKDGVVLNIHGGTETGVFQRLLPGIDIVGTGTNTNDVHTARESMDLASFGRVFEFLCKLLERMTKA
ncbi:MAG: beta-Ala-His dipeptidase [Chloroflexota bacterium]